MADNLKKTFTIEIAGVKESVTNLESLEDILVKMEKQVETINKNGGFSVVSKEANKNAKEAIDLAKAEQIAQGEVVSSYKDKQKALSTLGKEIKSMTVADGEAAKKQQEMIQQYNGLNDQLKRFDASMGNHQRNVGDYRGALKETTMQIKEMQGEMAQMLLNGIDKADPKFKALAQKAGELQDAIQDAREEVGRFASDTKKIDDVINIAQSATAAFELYKGAMSAFGIETEEAEKAMQKLVGAMSVIQSLQQLSNTLQEGSATAKLFSVALKATGAELVINQVNAIKAAAAQEGLSVAQKAGAVASKTLGLALKAIPLMLVISLVAALITHWEDIVGWFNKTFPVLKKLGGAFNGLKAVFVGVGKAILNWLINPLKTFANVIKAILAGDFAGAVKAVTEGFKNQFAGTVDAFKNDYQKQIEAGLEEITRKNAAEDDKILTHKKNMITKQKNADGTYRKEYIEANKKMFENKKKMYKKDSDEYRKVLEEEAQFNQQVEDAKTAAAKKGASERAKAAKDAAKEAKDAAKQEAEAEKNLLTARRALRNEIQNTAIVEEKGKERIQSLKLEGYDAGPIEKYIEELEKLREIQSTIYNKELFLTIASIGDYLEDNITMVKKTSAEWQTYIATVDSASAITFQFTDAQKKALSAQGKTMKEIEALEKEEINKILTEWQKVEGLKLKAVDDSNAKMIEQYKQMLSVTKNEMAGFSDDFQRRYKLLIDKVNAIGHEQVERNNIWGTVQTGKTLANLDILKAQWEEAYVDLSAIIKKEEERWKQYLENVKNIYGEDSSAFKKAQKEKEDALNPLLKKLNEVGQRANTPTSTETDYTGDNQASGSTKPKRKLWYGKNDKKSDGSGFSLIDNIANLATELDEMVLGPAMDTFNMFMDFAIEETQARLDEVMDMHDDALEKVEESTNKIKELNDSLKDSSNTNIEVTKQQLADEQLLYAQRLAEEQKLAQEERALQNKANEQEYQQRKMELGYQLILGIANTAQGASKALAEWGWPLGPIFAGVMAALGAVQTALIAKQLASLPKPKKLADGGLITGPSHKQGGIQVGRTGIEVEGGEAIINKRSTAKYLPLLDAINASGNGGKHTIANTDKRIRKFANGGTMNFENVDSNLRQNADTNKILNAMDKIDFNPVVSVVDFEKVQNRLVKVRSLAGR